MSSPLIRCTDQHRAAALQELRAELLDFSHDGLVQLGEDLTRHAVSRGSWSGCVISYRRGAPGSCRRDRLGRARNGFTVLWDNGWITDEEVGAAVLTELTRRGDAPPRTGVDSLTRPAICTRLRCCAEVPTGASVVASGP